MVTEKLNHFLMYNYNCSFRCFKDCRFWKGEGGLDLIKLLYLCGLLQNTT